MITPMLELLPLSLLLLPWGGLGDKGGGLDVPDALPLDDGGGLGVPGASPLPWGTGVLGE